MKRFVHIHLVLSLYGAWTSCSDSVSGNSIIDEPDSRVIKNWCGCPDKDRGEHRKCELKCVSLHDN